MKAFLSVARFASVIALAATAAQQRERAMMNRPAEFRVHVAAFIVAAQTPCQPDQTVICPFDRAAIDLCRSGAEQREHLKTVTVLLPDGTWWQTCGWQYRHDQQRALTSDKMKAPWRRGGQ
ncbi:MAG: hypothetical protein U0Z53_23600 [Blastocatellia bacterium]